MHTAFDPESEAKLVNERNEVDSTIGDIEVDLWKQRRALEKPGEVCVYPSGTVNIFDLER
ncbi:hypothetical protein N7532_009504 [Penicillium argentinense]|uniref:Uncharacterized protein n=1 Tax=Penicillium argentinense TaxID=1131581 RepID=A0A9W9EZM7_9EURO|nr:uncharacterized protein N7532_009504 [Penicillium argentinense]KAJ5090820.1 hypothetical protein N7532_009504 [Penicillium argentinense]